MTSRRPGCAIAVRSLGTPVEYVLTGKGWAAAEVAHPGVTMALSRKPTAAEARRLQGVQLRLVDAHPPKYLPAAPLLHLIEARGGPAACGVRPSSAEGRALFRARETGHLTRAAGDRLAVRVLGLTPWEVWT